jgi:ABC-type dipeptide/oligopeptide/nickel transport system permease component
VILIRHAVRNGMIPVLTIVGVSVSLLMGGSVIFEQIFGLPGLGRYLIIAVQTRDYTQVQAVALVFAVWVILINLLTDLLYGVIDPRVKL